MYFANLHGIVYGVDIAKRELESVPEVLR